MSVPSKNSECVLIKSPFTKGDISKFNNSGRFPDLEFSFPGLDEPLHLHRSVLSNSQTLASMFEAKVSLYGNYDENAHRVDWVAEHHESDAMYRDVLLKWLRLCYGEDQSFSVGECPAALAVLLQLNLEHKDELQNTIVSFMTSVASNNVEEGLKLVNECVIEYGNLPGDPLNSVAQDITKTVMTRHNIENHFDAVVDCIMHMPCDYLDLIEYGEPHSRTSEFSIRSHYASFNSVDVHDVMKGCDVNKLDTSELEELEAMGRFSPDELIAIYKNKCQKMEQERKVIMEEHRKKDFFVRCVSQMGLQSADKTSDFVKAVQASCYFCSFGVVQNKEEAAKLWRRGSSDPKAAALFKKGKDLKSAGRFAEAVQVFLQASKLYNANAMNELGICYRNGVGIEKDEKKAFEYYELASFMGQVDAIRNLGGCYKNGVGCTKDEKKAVELYQLSSELGCKSATNSLGVCYLNGNGVKQDMRRAFELFKEASDNGNGNARATTNLGLCYEKGLGGVEANPEEALRLYKLASRANDSDAFYRLGCCYENGVGVRASKDEAIIFYKKASERGSGDAKAALERLGIH